MKVREFARWLVWPPDSSLVVSIASALFGGLMLAIKLDMLRPAFEVSSGGLFLVSLTASFSFLAAAHTLGLLRRALRGSTPLSRSVGYLILSAFLFVAGLGVLPQVREEAPPPMADGGLAVFVTFPVDDLRMNVQRDSVGVGDEDRQIQVDLLLKAPVDRDFEIALVGSGASAFDVAAITNGVSSRSASLSAVDTNASVSAVKVVQRLDVFGATDLLPTRGLAGVAVSPDEPTAPTLLAPWYNAPSASAVRLKFLLSTGESPSTSPDGSTQFADLNLAFALRLKSASLGASRGDLGDVGCASDFDSVARAYQHSQDEAPAIVRIGGSYSGSGGAWQVPARCEVKVTIGQVIDHEVYVNGRSTGGAGVTLIEFADTSAREHDPIAGINTLTVSSSAYWVPRAKHDPNAWLAAFTEALRGLALAAFLSALKWGWVFLRKRPSRMGTYTVP